MAARARREDWWHTAEEVISGDEVGAQGQDDHGQGEGEEFGYHGPGRLLVHVQNEGGRYEGTVLTTARLVKY